MRASAKPAVAAAAHVELLKLLVPGLQLCLIRRFLSH
jgi:hypothetical protein